MEEIKNFTAQECEARLAQIKEEMLAEDANIEELSAEVDAITERRQALVTAEEQRKALADKVAKDATATIIERREEKKMDQMEIRNTPEYIDAFANYIKSGKDAECRALLTENVSGSVPVPEFVYEIVKTAWEREGIMSRVRKAYIKGNLKVGFEYGADGAYVHTEGDEAVAEENLLLGVVTLVPQSIKKWVSISDEVADLRGESFIRYIYDELTYQIAKKAADSLVSLIVNAPATSGPTTIGVSTVDVAALSVGTIAEAMGKLADSAANPVIIMNKGTWSSFKAVQYANGFSVDPFEGLPVVFNNSLKTFTAAGDGETFAIVGDLGEGALANFPNGDGIAFKYDDQTLMTEDLVRILGRQYVALGIVGPGAFVKLDKDI